MRPGNNDTLPAPQLPPAGGSVPPPLRPMFFAGCIAANTLIASFLTMVDFGHGFVSNLIYSQCIGLSIQLLGRQAIRLTPDSNLRYAAALLAIVTGSLLGLTLGNQLDGAHKPWDFALSIRPLGIGLFFGLIGTVYFQMRERAALLKSALKTRELQQLEAERRSIEAQLKMLQAQIEPHFLFNTLANLAGLIEVDPKLASRLLAALNRYLRASLGHTRAEGGTLGDEIDLLAAYLEVLKIRLGPRLDFTVSADSELRRHPFPPMLLQPLVENAILHGIEPTVAGGHIHISATQQSGELVIRVRDTGAGLGEQPGNGVGLTNIRARLAALFGEDGRLDITEHADGGVLACLRVPA